MTDDDDTLWTLLDLAIRRIVLVEAELEALRGVDFGLTAAARRAELVRYMITAGDVE